MFSPKTIQNIVKELIEKMAFQCDFISFNEKEENLVINIQLRDASILIGQNGTNLNALQHLARVIVQRKTGQTQAFILDINNYQRQKIDILKKMARDLAQRAIHSQRVIVLKPMPSFERRIIHLALVNRNGLETFSQGQGAERRVVIRPVSS